MTQLHPVQFVHFSLYAGLKQQLCIVIYMRFIVLMDSATFLFFHKVLIRVVHYVTSCAEVCV